MVYAKNMTRAKLVLACFILGLLAVCGVTLVGATGSYDLQTDTSVPVPETTVENPEDETEEFTVTHVDRVEPSENVSVTVTPPNENSYSVFFREDDGTIINREARIEGTQTVHLDPAGSTAGSYVITVGETSSPDTVLPVVIQAYSVSQLTLDGESLDGMEVTSDESPEVTVELQELEATTIETVTLTLWNSQTEEEVSLSSDGDQTFSGSLPNVDPDEYNTQIRIRGGDTVNSEPELIGLSANHDLTVTQAETTDDTDDGDAGEGGGTGGTGAVGDDDTDDDTDETTNETTDDETTNETTDDETTNETTDETTDDETTNGDVNDATNMTDTDSADTVDSDGTDVITPNSTTDGETDDDVPLTAIPTVVMLLVIIGAGKRLAGS